MVQELIPTHHLDSRLKYFLLQIYSSAIVLYMGYADMPYFYFLRNRT